MMKLTIICLLLISISHCEWLRMMHMGNPMGGHGQNKPGLKFTGKTKECPFPPTWVITQEITVNGETQATKSSSFDLLFTKVATSADLKAVKQKWSLWFPWGAGGVVERIWEGEQLTEFSPEKIDHSSKISFGEGLDCFMQVSTEWVSATTPAGATPAGPPPAAGPGAAA